MDDAHTETTRRRCTALFNSAYFAEVVLALDDERDDSESAVPLKHLVERAGLPRNVVNPVLTRLVGAELVHELRTGPRAPVSFDIVDRELWSAIVRSCRALATAPFFGTVRSANTTSGGMAHE